MKTDIILFKEKNSVYLKEISTRREIQKDDNCDGYLINAKGNEKETRKIVESLKAKDFKIGVIAYENQYNRRVIETMKIDYLIGVEKENKKDTLKQRDSGLNHVIVKLAKKKDISIVINLNEIIKINSFEKAIILSRIIQNIKVCRKAGCEIKIASFARNKEELINKKEREVFLFALGASSQQVKKACVF